MILNKPVSLFILSLLVLCVSCSSGTSETSKTMLAEFGEEYLYLEDIQYIPVSKSKEDSVQFINEYVKNWLVTKLVYEKAVLNINESDRLEKQAKEYKESLYIHYYEEMLSSQKMDESISTAELEDYYKKNLNGLLLNEDIVKPVFIVLSKKIDRIDAIKSWFMSNNTEDLDKLKDYCFQFSNKFYFGEDWVKKSALIRESPLKESEFNGMIANAGSIIKEDSLNLYFFRFNEVVRKDKPAPFDFIKNEIKAILIQKKKREFIYNTRNKIYQDALDKSKFKTYSDSYK